MVRWYAGVLVGVLVPALLSAQEQDKTPLAVGFAGSLATLEAPVVPWGHVCSLIHIFATSDPVRGTVVALEGLGPATLTRTDDGGCDESRDESVKLLVQFLDRQGDWLRLRVPVGLFPASGSLDGHVRVYAGDRDPLDIPVRLEARSSNAFVLAMSWFLGFAVPAFLGYYGVKFERRLQERAARREAFRDYVLANTATFDALFTDFLPNLSKTEQDEALWSAAMRTKLDEHMNRIPPEAQEQLVAVLRSAKRADALDLLARIYPAWATPIRSCL
jgi:hypothetical protein